MIKRVVSLVAVIIGLGITLLGGRVSAATPVNLTRSVGDDICPCAAIPFFAQFLDGQLQLLACTNDTPFYNFVRLVDRNINLVVLYESGSQLFCGWQPDGDYTKPTPITAAQFVSCKRLIVKAAAQQGLPCPREF